MNWKHEVVNKWREWRDDHSHKTSIVPPDVQVGKILEHCFLDEKTSMSFIEQNIASDQVGLDSFIVSDDYWLDVKKKFLELQVNQIIMAD